MLYQPKDPLPGARVIDPERVLFAAQGLCYEMAVEYGASGGKKLLMDYFYPAKHNGRMPAVIWIHGGGWSSHDLTRIYRPEKELAELAKLGFFCASIDYRLLDEAPFPAQIQDCKCAVRFLRAHAAELGIDPEHIGVWGESAGGHLAALLAVSNGVEEFEGDGGWQDCSSDVQAAVPWYAPCNLWECHQATGQEESIFTALMGCASGTEAFERKIRAASPSYYIDRALPPMLLMHGDRDSIVPYAQSEDFCRAARAAGNPVRLITVHDQGHGFFEGPEYYTAIENFFCQHLMGCQRSIVGGGRVVWAEPTDWDAIDVDYIPDVTYATLSGIDLKLDWMLPRMPDSAPRPVVVWFHGGGWRSEDLTRKYRPEGMIAELCKAGFVCVSADYRLLQQAAYPAPVQDARCVIRYIRAHAEKYNLNPGKIGVWGESAGGATANLLGVGQYLPHHEGDGGYGEYSSEVQAVCAWYGSNNQIKAMQLSGQEHNPRFGVDYDIDGPGAQLLWRESPIAYADRPLPPFLLIHGSADPLVPLWQSTDFFKELVSFGQDAELYIVPGEVHGFFTDPKVSRLIVDFFSKHLKV